MSPYAEGPTLGENPSLLGPDLDDEIIIGQFFLGPGDVVKIEVYQDARLNRVAPVRPDGTLRLHLVGDIPVAGMTLRGAEMAVAAAYDRVVVDPSVVMDIESWSSERKITVLGHVSRPSVLTMNSPRTTVLDIIAQCGGVLPSGDRTGILLARRVDGEIQIRPYDMDLLFAPSDPTIRTEYPWVQPGDVIYVLRTWQDEFDAVMNSVSNTLRATNYLERIIVGADQAITVL